jgi:hypothetical protein
MWSKNGIKELILDISKVVKNISKKRGE